MRRLLALLAVAAMVLLGACSSEEGSTDTTTPSTDSSTDSSTPDSGPAMDTTDAAKDAPADITYECSCGKTSTQAADLPAPS